MGNKAAKPPHNKPYIVSNSNRFRNPFKTKEVITTKQTTKQTTPAASSTRYIRTTPTTEPPTTTTTTTTTTKRPKTPGEKNLEQLKEQLAQTSVRLHFYQQQRNVYEQEHKSATPWGSNRSDEAAETAKNMDTPAERFAKLKAQLEHAKTQLVTTKAKVQQKRIENGREETLASRPTTREEVKEEVVQAETHHRESTTGATQHTEGGDGTAGKGEVSAASPPASASPSSTSFPGNDFFDSDVSSDGDGEHGDGDEGWL